MTTKHIGQLAIIFTLLICSCKKGEEDCGAVKVESSVIYDAELFLQPSEIFWGVTGNTRTYTYNWTFPNNCTNSNPKVSFNAGLHNSNNTLSNPFTIDAGTQTCLGVSSQPSILAPDFDHKSYESADAEIGMNQCFGGQSSGTIYPFLRISFTSLGNSHDDSVYLVHNLYFIKATRQYNLPK